MAKIIGIDLGTTNSSNALVVFSALDKVLAEAQDLGYQTPPQRLRVVPE